MNGPIGRRSVMLSAVATLALLAAPHSSAGSAAAITSADDPFLVEYYYKIRWGHFNEWVELYKKNHYPILAKLQEQGEIIEMSASSPRYHAGEGTRWDFRFTIVWRDAATATADADREPIISELYPDRATFEAEEQRRFQLLEEHLDVPVVKHDLATW